MSEQRVDWRRVSRGVLWIGIGAFLLMNTLGRLPWSIWPRAVAYWPVLLVALGLRVIFERSRIPWAVLLSPLLVLATLGWVASGRGGPAASQWSPVRAERPSEAERWRVEGGVAMARLRLTTRALPDGVLARGRAAAPHDTALEIGGTPAEPRMRLRGRRSRRFALASSARETWELELARDLPLTLDLDMAFTTGEIDLADAPVSRVALDGAFNALTLRLGAPASETRVHFEGAFNALDVIVPPRTPVRISTDGFLNVHKGRSEVGGFEGPGYRLTANGAFNRVRVRSE